MSQAGGILERLVTLCQSVWQSLSSQHQLRGRKCALIAWVRYAIDNVSSERAVCYKGVMTGPLNQSSQHHTTILSMEITILTCEYATCLSQLPTSTQTRDAPLKQCRRLRIATTKPINKTKRQEPH